MIQVIGNCLNFFKKKKERYIVELRFIPTLQIWGLFSTVGNKFKTEQEALDFCDRFDFQVIRPIETPVEVKAEVQQ